jgi:hypothetical protein
VLIPDLKPQNHELSKFRYSCACALTDTTSVAATATATALSFCMKSVP